MNGRYEFLLKFSHKLQSNDAKGFEIFKKSNSSGKQSEW